MTAGETTPDGRVTLLRVECLCACEVAPMMQVDEEYVGPLDRGADRPRPGGPPVSEPVLSRNFDRPEARTLPGYRARRRLRGVPEGARARPRGHRRRGQEGEPPRPGRRRLPDGDEVGLHPAEAHGPRLSRRQRRRGRAGDVQGPLHPRARSPRPDRGDADRGLRDRLPHVLHLHPRRVRPPVAGLPRRPSRRPRPPACWAPTSSARDSTTRWSCTGARAPTSAARRRGSSPPSRARRGGRRSSPRSPRSRAPSASRRWSTTSRRWPRCRTSSRAGASGSRASGPRPRAGRASTRCRATWPAPASTRRRWGSRSGS